VTWGRVALVALSVRNLLLGTLGELAVTDGAIRDGLTLEARLEGFVSDTGPQDIWAWESVEVAMATVRISSCDRCFLKTLYGRRLWGFSLTRLLYNVSCVEAEQLHPPTRIKTDCLLSQRHLKGTHVSSMF